MSSFLPLSCFTFFFFFAIGTSYVVRNSAGDDTILHLLEGNVTASPFDDDGTDFDIFTYLFTASSHASRLEEDIPGDITVLAPDDNAFRQAIGDLGLQTTSELETYENLLIYLMQAYRYPFDFLTRILYYHVIPGALNSTSVLQMPSMSTWDTPSRITLEGTSLIDRDPRLPNPKFDMGRLDIQARNGVVHVIDYVLFPEVIREIDVSKMDDECASPEPSTDEIRTDTGLGPVPSDDDAAVSPDEDSLFQFSEPAQSAEDLPVVTVVPSNEFETFPPNLEPQQANEVTTLSTSADSPAEEEEEPSLNPQVDSPQETNTSNSEEPVPFSSHPAPIEVRASASPVPREDTSEAATSHEPKLQDPIASVSHSASQRPVQTEATKAKDVGANTPEPMGEPVQVSNPTSAEVSPELDEDEIGPSLPSSQLSPILEPEESKLEFLPTPSREASFSAESGDERQPLQSSFDVSATPSANNPAALSTAPVDASSPPSPSCNSATHPASV